MIPYIAYLEQDSDHGPPDKEWDTIFEVKTASERRYDDYDRDQMVVCDVCSTNHDDWEASGRIKSPDGRVLYHSEEDGIPPHTWTPSDYTKYFLDGDSHNGYSLVEIGATQPSAHDIDGVLELTRRGREEWNDMNAAQRLEIAKAELAEFTAWANGDVYYIELAKRTQCSLECDEDCDEDFENHHEIVESCGGIFDMGDGLHDWIKSELAHELGVPYTEVKEHVHYETEYRYH